MKTYVYCSIMPANYQDTYYYISDIPVAPGDYVIIPLRADNKEKVGLVMDVLECTEATAPYPPGMTKRVIRIFSNAEPAELEKEKKKLDKERAIYFKSEELTEKLKIKEALLKYGVDKEKKSFSKKLIKEMLESVSEEKEKIAEIVTDISNGIQLSEDGKTITKFIKKWSTGTVVVRIPDGVETIEDNAFLRVKFDTLYIPKTLKNIGEYTLFDRSSAPIWDHCPKDIKSIEVEEGNPYFTSDEVGFYTINGGKKELCFLYDRTIEEYSAPDYVASFSKTAFYGCYNLKKVNLSSFTEEFNEYSLGSNSSVEEIFIPKNVKKIIPKALGSGYAEWSTVRYKIHEENRYYFKDEDSVYEVLPDGTYKLVINTYLGKGRTLILDNTSEIGEDAFSYHENITDIQLPQSLRIIDKNAFSYTGLKNVRIPKGIIRIAEGAFYGCPDLKSVKISSSIEDIAEDAFGGCFELKHFETESKTNMFKLKDGIVVKKQVSRAVDTSQKNKKAMKASKDYFAEFANIITKIVTEESVSNKYRADDRVHYDSEKRIVTITSLFEQAHKTADIVRERIEAAEHLNVNDPVKIKINGTVWEVVTEDGKSLGELDYFMCDAAIPYINRIAIKNATISDIIPKSARRANAKYAKGSVNFEITERIMPDNLNEHDYEIMEHFAYRIDEEEAKIIRWIGSPNAKKVIFPKAIEGKPVVSIGDVFSSRDYLPKIETIIIPEGVKRLETAVFSSCDKLKKVVIPATVEYISQNVFSDKTGEYKDIFLSEDIVFVVPAGSFAEKFLNLYQPEYGDYLLTVINDETQEKTEHFNVLDILSFKNEDDGLTASFKNSYLLPQKFEEKVVSIPDRVNGRIIKSFNMFGTPGCIEKLIIPGSIENLINLDYGSMFYSGGKNLKSIEISEDNPNYWSDGFAIFSKDKKCLIRFMSYLTKTYSVPEGTESISKYGFAEAENLKSLAFPQGIKYIGSRAFEGCANLSKIQGLENIADVGHNIFGRVGYSSVPFGKNDPFLIIGTSLLRCNDYSQNIVQIPQGVKRICEGAFSEKNENDSVEEIILPDSVCEIEAYAFDGRKKLKKINIPEGVKEIRVNTFRGCNSLESLYIPSTVEKIFHTALPKPFEEDGMYDNNQNSALRLIEVDQKNNNYCSDNGMLFSKDKTELLYVPSVIQKNSIEIPQGVIKICTELAFKNKTLKELVIPDTVKYIEKYAFYGCENLEKVIFSSDLELIGAYSFSGCDKLKIIVWPKSLKTIEDCAFEDCGLTELNLPDTIEKIGEQAFANIKAKKVTLPQSVQQIGWGVFSCIPEIVVYDSFDPNAKTADAGIDICNGEPNSMVGYIGMGPAWAMWQCAANHEWVDYTIVVKSSETDEVKYKVWMGADDSQRQYYCFLSSAWGKNATFAFKKLDEFFPKIRGTEHKLQVAKYRLEYPCDLSEEARTKYENYIKRNS